MWFLYIYIYYHGLGIQCDFIYSGHVADINKEDKQLSTMRFFHGDSNGDILNGRYFTKHMMCGKSH